MNPQCFPTHVQSFRGIFHQITSSGALIGLSLSLASLVTTLSGCGGAISAKSENYDVATATAKVLETYDRNGDGQLSAVELKACPALANGMRHIDRNGDGKLTEEEIRARMQSLDDQSDFIGLDLQVTAKGRPLVGAQLTLTPEPFMGDGLQSYSGTTVEGGGCPLKGEKKLLPGIPIGFYRVQVVQADQGINEVRGCEIADDTTGNRLQIAL
jgi:EF hand